MTDPKKLLPGLSALFGFSVFVVAAIRSVTSIFEIALREQREVGFNAWRTTSRRSGR